jgi:hypothetical protein
LTGEIPACFRRRPLAALAKQRRFAMLFSTHTRPGYRTIGTAPIWPALLLLCALMVPSAQADPGEGREPTPEVFNVVACYRVAQHEGRMVAWARWEKRFPLEKIRSVEFEAGTPTWVIDRIQAWILDAYTWQVTDDQVQQWATELGNTEDLPRANGLTIHQKIAIWMRRISRQCDDQQARVSAPEAVVMRRHGDPDL